MSLPARAATGRQANYRREQPHHAAAAQTTATSNDPHHAAAAQTTATSNDPHYAGAVRTTAVVAELSRPGFLAALDSLLSIYAAAMGAQPEELAARRSIMARHTRNPAFRAVIASGAPQRIVGFAYGFHGASGQWWHDVVGSAITRRAGAPAMAAWLSDAMEVAEVHVHPDHQARGIGRQMMHALTGGRPERTALLSTRDAQSPARRLYRSLGFVDLLTSFQFPGGGPLYAVMGAPLPLPPGPRPGPPPGLRPPGPSPST